MAARSSEVGAEDGAGVGAGRGEAHAHAHATSASVPPIHARASIEHRYRDPAAVSRARATVARRGTRAA